MVAIDKERLPRHVAIIMDGNGRWAVQRGLSRVSGHRRGKDSVKEVVETARRLGIPYLSLYAFSSENWHRPKDEVSALMRFLRHYLVTEVKRMMKNGIRLLTIGNIRKLPREVQLALRDVVERTKRNTGMTVILAVSYGGREELTEAVRAIALEIGLFVGWGLGLSRTVGANEKSERAVGRHGEAVRRPFGDRRVIPISSNDERR